MKLISRKLAPLTLIGAIVAYFYPPDLAKMEADRVLEQSDLLASELTS
jgi:hypothetical protein